MLLSEPVEALLGLDRRPVERLLGAPEGRVERADPGRTVDVHDGGKSLGHPVARSVAGEAGRAVNDEDDGCVVRADRPTDRLDVVGEGDRRPVRVGRLEAGQGDRGDVVAVGPEQVGDLVPRPGPEPEAWDENDRRGAAVSPVGHGASRSARRSSGDRGVT